MRIVIRDPFRLSKLMFRQGMEDTDDIKNL